MIYASGPPRIAVILAGGQSRRMGALDKASFKIGGKRLIDHVMWQASPQSDILWLAGSKDYETGLRSIADIPNQLAGPVAGLWAVAQTLQSEMPSLNGFFTVPIDGPLFPIDLFDRLKCSGKSAIVETDAGLQPTFAYWKCEDILAVLGCVAEGQTLSLKALARDVEAEPIWFEDGRRFANVNRPEDGPEIEAYFFENQRS